MINVKMLLLLVFITMRHGFRFLLPLFQNFHINHSFFKIFIIIRFSSFLCCISRKTVDTEYTYYSWCMTSTDIVKWRKTNDHENFEKGMIYMKILKRGRGSREKGGGGNEIHAPCACGVYSELYVYQTLWKRRPGWFQWAGRWNPWSWVDIWTF